MTGAARAQWHQKLAAPSTEYDPFDAIEEEKVWVAVEDPVHKIELLVGAEARLHRLGVTCPIREEHSSQGSCCHACSENHSLEDTRMAQLCRLGILIEKTATDLSVKRKLGHGDPSDNALEAEAGKDPHALGAEVGPLGSAGWEEDGDPSRVETQFDPPDALPDPDPPLQRGATPAPERGPSTPGEGVGGTVRSDFW